MKIELNIAGTGRMESQTGRVEQRESVLEEWRRKEIEFEISTLDSAVLKFARGERVDRTLFNLTRKPTNKY